MNKIIWIIGGMASGKSTLRRNLSEAFREHEDEFYRIEYNSLPVIYTKVSDTCAVVGKTSKTSACDGLDSCFGELKKEGAINSVKYCALNYEITILEGSQTSQQWVEPLKEFCIGNNVDLYIFYIDLHLWDNFNRLLERIQKRGGDATDMTDKRIASITTKNSQFRKLYEKYKGDEFIKIYPLEGVSSADEKLIQVYEKVFNVKV